MRTLLRSCSIAAVVLACALSAGATAQAPPRDEPTASVPHAPVVAALASDSAYIVKANVEYLMGSAVALPMAFTVARVPVASRQHTVAPVWHPPGGRQCAMPCPAGSNEWERPPAVIVL